MDELYSPLEPDVRRNPYPRYKRLREEAPVYFVKSIRSYAVSRYHDARFVLENPSLFSSSIMRGADALLLGADPPEHTRIRKLVNQYFTRPTIANLQSEIDKIADRLLEEACKRDSVDIIRDLAKPLPVTVISRIMGVGDDHLTEFIAWSDAYVARGALVSGQSSEATDGAITQFVDFIERLIRSKEKQPGEDLVSSLVKLELENQSILRDEIVRLCLLLIVAGNETTTNLIGNVMVNIFRNDAVRKKIVESPHLVRSAIQEMNRFDPPVQLVFRQATEDVTLSGTTIPEGAAVAVLLGSANRDQEVFSNPDVLDIERDFGKALSFGSGIHFCLGSHLAILEASILVRRMLDLGFEEIESELEYIESLHLRGVKSLFARVA